NAGEIIDFSFSVLGWTPADCDKYSWNFGDGTAASTAKSPNHTFASAGNYTVTLFIDGGLSDATVTRQVKVGTGTTGGGGGGGGGGGTGGGGGSCAEMQPGLNVSVAFNGASSGCSALNGTCSASENITFSLATSGYNLGCATHSYEWDFGDSSAKSTAASPAHAFGTAGTYSVTLKLTRIGQTATLSRTVAVGTGNGGGGGGSGTGRPQMQPGPKW